MPVRGDEQQQQQLLCRKLNARPCASYVCVSVETCTFFSAVYRDSRHWFEEEERSKKCPLRHTPRRLFCRQLMV